MRFQVDMPVFFYIDPEFCDDPKMERVEIITLSYTFFEAKEGMTLPFPSYMSPPSHATAQWCWTWFSHLCRTVFVQIKHPRQTWNENVWNFLIQLNVANCFSFNDWLVGLGAVKGSFFNWCYRNICLLRGIEQWITSGTWFWRNRVCVLYSS